MTKIYHNPRCSKSRQTLELLKANSVEAEIVEYLETPLKEDELLALIEMLGGEPQVLVRVKEDLYKENPFDTASAQTVAKELADKPKLMERPVVVSGNKAAIGRPPETVLTIL